MEAHWRVRCYGGCWQISVRILRKQRKNPKPTITGTKLLVEVLDIDIIFLAWFLHQSADFTLRYSAEHSHNSCWQRWTRGRKGPAIQYEIYPDKVVVSGGNSAGDRRQQDSSGLCILKTTEMDRYVKPSKKEWQLPDGTLLTHEAGRVWNSGDLLLQGLAWRKSHHYLKPFNVWPSKILHLWWWSHWELCEQKCFLLASGQDKWLEDVRWDDSRKEEGTFRDVLSWRLELCIE